MVVLKRYRRVGALLEELKRLNAGDGKRKRIFIVPDKDDVRTLKDALREEFSFDLSGRSGLRDFEIFRWSDFYKYMASGLGQRALGQIDPPDHWLVLNGIMEDLLKRYRKEEREVPPGVGRSGFVQILGDAVREFIAEGVGPGHVREYGDGSVVLEVFAQAYEAYVSVLEGQGLIDSAGVASASLELLGFEGARDFCRSLDLVLVGFYSLTHSQLALVRALNGLGCNMTVFSPETGLEGEYSLASQLGLEGLEMVDSDEPVRVFQVVSGDVRQEYENVARMLHLWGKGVTEDGLEPLGDVRWRGWDDVMMIVPRSSIREAEEVFRRYGIPANWSSRRPMSETAVWELARGAFEVYVEDFPFEATLRLTSSPWLGGDVLPVGQAKEKRPAGRKQWEAFLARWEEPAEKFRRVCDFARALLKGGSSLDLLKALRKMCAGLERGMSLYVLDMPELDYELDIFNKAVMTMDEKIESLEKLVRDLGAYGQRKMAGAEAMAFLKVWMEENFLMGGSEMGEQVSVYFDRAPVLTSRRICVFSGGSANAFPGNILESPVIREDFKRRLHDLSELGLGSSHLPLLEERRSQKEAIFRRLMASGEELCVFSYAIADSSGKEKKVSPFLGEAMRVIDGKSWVDGSSGEYVRTLGQLLVPRHCVKLDGVESFVPLYGRWGNRAYPGRDSWRFDVRMDRVSMSSVQDYAVCPLMFVLKNYFRFNWFERGSLFNAALAGNAVHGLWEEVWKVYVELDYASSIHGLVRERFDDVVSREYGDLMKNPALRRARENLYSNVCSLALRIDAMEEGYLRQARRRSFVEWDVPNFEYEGIDLVGRMDRVDLLEDGKVIIWDYKSGRSSRQFARVGQLLAYGFVLDRSLKNGVVRDLSDARGVCGLSFLYSGDGQIDFMGDREIKGRILNNPSVRGNNLEEEFGNFEERVLKPLAASVREGLFEPRYGRHCQFCSFGEICRRSEFGVLDEEDDNDD